MELKENKFRINLSSSEEALSIPAIWQKRRLEEVDGRVSKKLEVIEKMNARGKDNILDCWVDWWERMQFWTGWREETKLNEKLSIHQV